jgi:hypothetical protein
MIPRIMDRDGAPSYHIVAVAVHGNTGPTKTSIDFDNKHVGPHSIIDQDQVASDRIQWHVAQSNESVLKEVIRNPK